MKDYTPRAAIDRHQFSALVNLVGPRDALDMWELYQDEYPAVQERRIFLGTAIMLAGGAFPRMEGRGWTVGAGLAVLSPRARLAAMLTDPAPWTVTYDKTPPDDSGSRPEGDDNLSRPQGDGWRWELRDAERRELQVPNPRGSVPLPLGDNYGEPYPEYWSEGTATLQERAGMRAAHCPFCNVGWMAEAARSAGRWQDWTVLGKPCPHWIDPSGLGETDQVVRFRGGRVRP
jgi:hypothetical protein